MASSPSVVRIVLAVAALSIASGAIAHPRLLSTTPADHSTGGAAKTVVLGFSENLLPKFSGVAIVMTAAPGMASGKPMPVASTSAVAGDGKTLVVTPSQPLAAGSYQVSWHVVADDTHAAKGSFAFDVK